MCNAVRLVILFIAISVPLSGCVSVVDATTDGPLQIDPGKRSFGEYVDDKKLKTVVAVNIKKADPALDQANISVYSYNSVILLTGEVASAALRKLAGDTARKVNKVRQVYNELTIGPQTTFLSRANDTWIQSRIKSKLIFHQDIEANRVEVIIENNIVYLMGRLSKIQAEKITNIVRSTRGVTKVVRAIEYIE